MLQGIFERIIASDLDRQTAKFSIRIARMNRFAALRTTDIVCDG